MNDCDWYADTLSVTLKIPESWGIVPTIIRREGDELVRYEPEYRGGFYYQTFIRSELRDLIKTVQGEMQSHETPTAKACMELLFKLPQPTG